MPAFNEVKDLHSTLNRLQLSDCEELIVVDGGSDDGTVSEARNFTDKVYVTKSGRASVMNFGAKKADGDILLFLHADCVLPDSGFKIIRETLSDDNIAAGAFFLHIDNPNPVFRIIELVANFRSRITSLLYGDQGIFLRKEVFDWIGGYAEIPLMEDIEISGRLKKTGKIALKRPAIKASPRRWLKEGALYTTLRDWSIAFSYTFLKVSPEKLIKYYGDVR
jgi:rSAM/selenodomain-associated transferase 2